MSDQNHRLSRRAAEFSPGRAVGRTGGHQFHPAAHDTTTEASPRTTTTQDIHGIVGNGGGTLVGTSGASADTGRLLNELVALLRLKGVEAHTAWLRVAQARTAAVRRELQDTAREADQRGELIQDQLRRLGGNPDALADAFGLLTVLTKSAAERVQPLSEGLLGDLTLEHQLRDRVVFIRVLAQARNETGVADLMRRLEAVHTENIEWIRVRLAEVAQGGPAVLAPTAAQVTVATVARLATLPAAR